MGLNKTSGNMYPWVTHTWNPVGGRCHHECDYCYMKEGFLGKLEKYHGSPELASDAFSTDLGSNNIIFVGSAIDLFGDWIPEEMIKKVLSYCKEFSNNYLFQSKNPARIGKLIDQLPKGSLIGTTLETNREYDVSKAPQPPQRFKDFISIDYPKKMVSIEPIIDFDLEELVGWIKEINPEFVSIGADSKDNGLSEPEGHKIESLIKEIRKNNIKVILKHNLKRLLGNYPRLKKRNQDIHIFES